MVVERVVEVPPQFIKDYAKGELDAGKLTFEQFAALIDGYAKPVSEPKPPRKMPQSLIWFKNLVVKHLSFVA